MVHKLVHSVSYWIHIQMEVIGMVGNLVGARGFEPPTPSSRTTSHAFNISNLCAIMTLYGCLWWPKWVYEAQGGTQGDYVFLVRPV